MHAFWAIESFEAVVTEYTPGCKFVYHTKDLETHFSAGPIYWPFPPRVGSALRNEYQVNKYPA